MAFTSVPRPAAVIAPRYTWTGIDAATRQAIELKRPDMLALVQAQLGEGDGDYWLGDETYDASGITIVCHLPDGERKVRVAWSPADRSFSALPSGASV